MSEKYKIAFVPLDAFGHVNACLGMAHDLRDRGHNCVFIVNQNWKELIEKHGFENKNYIEEHKLGDTGSWNDFMAEYGETLKFNSFEKIRAFEASVWPVATNDVKLFNDKIKQILNDIKPDAIVVDSFILIPAVVSAGVPYIELCSANPVAYFADERLPPGGSGYPTNSEKELWKEFIDESIDAYRDSWNEYNSWLESEGADKLQHGFRFINKSPFLNVYLCPQELSYDDIAPQDSKWCSLDSMMRTEVNNKTEEFEIPDKLQNKPGKLIYLSMGTLVCSEPKLMNRLVSILSKLKHRFIISKGPNGDQLELSDNIWGQNSIPQLQILPLVDLVITHGGNNTVTESLYFGKPMIVLPVFGDQFDNAQRVTEKGLGIRLDPYYCTESELSDAIEKLANDLNLKERLQQISKRIKESKSRERAAIKIEDVIRQSKIKINE